MLLIYSDSVTPRTEYIFELVFKHEFGLQFTSTTDINIFHSHKDEKICYSAQQQDNCIYIKPSSLLFETSIYELDVQVASKRGIPVLFSNESGSGFDIFAAIFYMVTRYEEYLFFTADKHGRYQASETVAYKNNFLQKPVVNIWLQIFKEQLLEKYPQMVFKQNAYKAIVTYDIDIAYAYKGRGLFRTIGATAKDVLTLKLKKLFGRFKTLATNKDPWDVYEYLEITIKQKKLNSIFFFLLGNYSSHDKNIKHSHSLMVKLVNKISSFSDIGIHPSYKSSLYPKKITLEKKRLEKISGKPINKSRQHYLNFKLPDTYNELIKAGISEDYSMGFADSAGFRAGICTPFYFYDLQNEKATSLKIFPVTCMEGTFLYYLKMTPKDSLPIIENLIKEVKIVQGTFISIWHNNTVSDQKEFKGWKWLHNEMLGKI